MAHQHYKGTGNVHSFRGLLVDGAKVKIRIQGMEGNIAWRITKFQLMVTTPGAADVESCVKVFREKPASVTNTIDFSEEDLLAAGYTMDSGSAANFRLPSTVIFDNALFVRNIYVTNFAASGSASCNYYIELEEVKVSAAGIAQLSVAAARRLS